jgi:hypothetical protein
MTQARFWLLCLLYVDYLLNHLSSDVLGGLTPIEIATGQRPDISALLQFRWFEPVLYSVDHSFASDSPEKSGRWVGVADNQGDALTYLILNDDTQKVVTRSAVRTALDSTNPNLRARPNPGFSQATSSGTTSSPSSGDGESPSTTPIFFSTLDLSGLNIDSPDLKLPHFSPDELLGLTFIRDMDDGSKYRAKVAHKIVDNDAANHQKIKFLVEMSDGKLEEIIAYNELSDVIERQHEAELHSPDSASWAFKEITEHQGPLTPSDRRYKGSSYNVLVHWEDGSETLSLSLSWPKKILSLVPNMQKTMTFLINRVGSLYNALLFALSSSLGCVDKPSFKLKGEVLPTSLGFYSQQTETMHSESTRITMITFGRLPLVLKWIKLPNTTPFAIWGEVKNLQVIINVSVFTSSSMSSMTSVASLVLLLVAIW